jgi:hypothetical protein
MKEDKSAKGHSQEKYNYASVFKKPEKNTGNFENKENKLK